MKEGKAIVHLPIDLYKEGKAIVHLPIDLYKAVDNLWNILYTAVVCLSALGTLSYNSEHSHEWKRPVDWYGDKQVDITHVIP